MRYLLFNIEGHRPSGVWTFCRRLVESISECYVVSLNCGKEGIVFENEIVVAEAESHVPDRIVDAILRFDLEVAGEDWVICPNVGEVCYETAIRLAALFQKKEALSVGLLGICHSDDENQYRVLGHYSNCLGAIVAVSPVIFEQLLVRFPAFAQSRVFRISYPLPERVPGNSFNTHSGPLALVYAGRFDREQKRVDRLPLLIKELDRIRVSYSLEIIGDGRDRDFLESQIESLKLRGLARAVKIRGPVDEAELLEIFSKKHILVLVSDYEGTPIVVLEAMAVGICALVMEMPSNQEGVLAEQALVVPRGDVAAMAEWVAELDRDRKYLCEISNRMSRVVRAEHSVQICFEQLTQASCVALRANLNFEDGAFFASRFHINLVENALRTVKHLPPGTRVGVFGAGMIGRQVVDSLFDVFNPPICLLDSDLRRAGSEYRGVLCGAPELVLEYEPDVVLIASERFASEMSERLLSILADSGISVKIVRLDQRVFID